MKRKGSTTRQAFYAWLGNDIKNNEGRKKKSNIKERKGRRSRLCLLMMKTWKKRRKKKEGARNDFQLLMTRRTPV